MSDHSSPEQLKKDIRVYMTIFGALLVGTVLTGLEGDIKNYYYIPYGSQKDAK